MRHGLWMAAWLCVMVGLAANLTAAETRDGSTKAAVEASAAPVATVQFAPHLPWVSRHWAGRRNTEMSWRERLDDGVRFHVADPDKRHVWTYYYGTPIDWQQTPILVMRYRATGTEQTTGSYVIWMDDTTGPNNGGIRPFRTDSLTPDGQVREIRCDLRELNPKGELIGMALGVMCAPDAKQATFDWLGLWFELAEGQPAPPAVTETDEPIRVRVVDANQKPLAGATVTVDAERLDLQRSAQTDEQGMATVTPLRNAFGRHMLQVSKPGSASGRFVDTSKITQDPIPVTLPGVQTYSGQVVDEAGQPIARAVVIPPGRSARTRYELRIAPQLRAVTDAQGRFSVEDIASGHADVQMRLIHPDYISDQWGGQSSKASASEFLAGKATLVMSKGVNVTGVVRDQSGQPIAGASVATGDDQFPSNAPPSTTTDEQGRFVFTQIPSGALALTVAAKGHHPAMLEVQATPDMTPLEVALGEPAAVRFRVVDEQGQPIQGATVYADTWRGRRTLQWDVQTDEQGRVTWDSAPTDAVLYDIYAKDRMRVRRKEVTAGGDEEVVVTLKPAMVLRGKVTDAATGEPIERFKVLPGIGWDNRAAVHYENYNVAEFVDGRYEMTFTSPYPKRYLRIEAPGYRLATSEAVLGDGGTHVIDFALEKAEPIVGTVRAADGTPVGGAKVFLVEPGQNMYIQDGMTVDYGRAQPTVTDAEGRFELVPRDENVRVIILAEQGYVEVGSDDLQADGEVTLEPWGRVEGVIYLGDEPAVDRPVNLDSQDARPHSDQVPSISFNYRQQTDAQGRFTFDRVKPGRATVNLERHIDLGSGRWQTRHELREPVEVLAGETVRIEFGNTGRPVVGRIVVPDDRKVDWRYVQASLRERQEPPYPDGWAQMSLEQRQQWYQQWIQSDEGKAYLAKVQEQGWRQGFYALVIEADSRFRMPTVEPGEYDLSVEAFEPPTDSRGVWGEQFGLLRKVVTIPPLAAGSQPEPTDLGELELTIRKTVNVGDAAPLFEVPTLDGQTVKLADLRGKWVLLDFWATWCGPCIGETPNLKRVWEAFGQREDFAMVGLSLDEKQDAPREYAEKNELGWIQGFLGSWSQSTLPNAYGVRGIPQIMLIDPEGKIVAKNLRGDRIYNQVNDALNP